jgi:acylphosphatase
MIARRIRVTGRVQGVFFRAWTRDEARSLGASGWVRNCPDGAVEAHIEGEEEAVTQLIRRMRHGPPHAKVFGVEIAEVDPQGADRFEVRH